MYLSLYRRYRPQFFADVVGQEPAVAVLVRGLLSGRTGQAYLFSGPRGSGKTTLARLLAKAVNCSERKGGAEPCGHCRSCLSITDGESLDVMEIDGASNNGVEEVRELKAKVALAPFASPVKVYIIDEVHMLSMAAFNALLKTLEEPPEQVLFILATTEPQKVPVTIRSRCQHIPFRRIAVAGILERLRRVCDEEETPYEEEALWEIARQADGALRDALSLLEQALSFGEGRLSLAALRALSGGGTRVDLERWVSLLPERPGEADRELREMIASGVSPERLLDGAFLLFRDLWVCRNWGGEVLAELDLAPPEREYLLEEASRWSAERLWRAMRLCQELMGRARLGLRGDVLAGLLSVSLAESGRTSVGLPRSSEEKGSGEMPGPGRKGAMAPPDVPRSSAPASGPFPPPFPANFGPEREGLRSAPDRSGGERTLSPSLPEIGPSEPSSERTTAETGDPGTFEALRERLGRRDPVLAASLLHCRVDLREGILEISVPREEPFPFSVLTAPRGLCQLALAAKEAGFGEGCLKVGDEIRPLVVQEADEGDEARPFLIPQDRRRRSDEGERAAESPQAEGAPSPQRSESALESQVERVLRWTSGDLLVLRAEAAAESEEKPLVAQESLDEEELQE